MVELIIHLKILLQLLLSEQHQAFGFLDLALDVCESLLNLPRLYIDGLSQEALAYFCHFFSDDTSILKDDAIDGLLNLVSMEVDDGLLDWNHVGQHVASCRTEEKPLKALRLVCVDGACDGIESDSILVQERSTIRLSSPCGRTSSIIVEGD